MVAARLTGWRRGRGVNACSGGTPVSPSFRGVCEVTGCAGAGVAKCLKHQHIPLSQENGLVFHESIDDSIGIPCLFVTPSFPAAIIRLNMRSGQMHNGLRSRLGASGLTSGDIRTKLG